MMSAVARGKGCREAVVGAIVQTKGRWDIAEVGEGDGPRGFGGVAVLADLIEMAFDHGVRDGWVFFQQGFG